MNLDLSSQEYRDLLDILHIADVVMSGHRSEEDKRSERHRALVRKLYALAGDEGLEQLINVDPNTNIPVPTAEFEQTSLAHGWLDEFGNHLFWDQLISRLIQRDTTQMGGGRLAALSDNDRRLAEEQLRQRYVNEFSANGITNLEIIERFNNGWGGQVKTSD